MEERALGRSGVAVSRVILGCGNFGGIGSAPAFFGQGTTREEAFRLLDEAWELGVTTLDTADAYGGGRSEAFIGAWLATKGAEVRDRVVVATKTFNPMTEGADRGLAGDAHPAAARVEPAPARASSASRSTSPTTSIPDVPQEETLQAFDELVRDGLVGAVGASNFTADQLAEALELSALEGLARYEWVQNAFSLLVPGRPRDGLPALPRARARVHAATARSPVAG